VRQVCRYRLHDGLWLHAQICALNCGNNLRLLFQEPMAKRAADIATESAARQGRGHAALVKLIIGVPDRAAPGTTGTTGRSEFPGG